MFCLGFVARLGPATVADAVVIRFPPAAHELDDDRVIWLCRLEDILRQCHAIVLGVDDIADTLRLLGEKRGGDEGKEEKVFHDRGIVAT